MPNEPPALSLPRRYFVDPAQHERELEALFLSSWICIGRATSLDAPGRHLVRNLGGESVIVLRDEAGQLRAYHNVCRHRGTRLCDATPLGDGDGRACDGGAPRLGGRIQCPYHAWTWSLDGRLVGAPHMQEAGQEAGKEGGHEPGDDGAAPFRKEDWPLRPVAVDSWDGHLFVHLGDLVGVAIPPLAAALEELPARLAPWRTGTLRVGARRTYDVRANWKHVVLNYHECLHCPQNHPQLQRLSHYLTGDNAPPRDGWLAGRMTLRDGVETLSRDGKLHRAPLPGLDEALRRKVDYVHVLPNLLLNLHPDHVMAYTVWPRAIDRTEVVCEWLFAVEEVERDGFDPADVVAFWDETNRQDWRLAELAQEGTSSRAYTPGPYSPRESLLVAIDRLVVERTSAR